MLIAQGGGDFRCAKSAVAFAEQIGWRAGASMMRQVQRDHLGDRLRVLPHAVKILGVVGFRGAAPAGADRVDQHEIGEGEPALRIVDEVGVGAVTLGRPEVEPARSHKAQMQECGGRARATIEDEGHRSIRMRLAAPIPGDIAGVEHRRRALAALVVEVQRPGRRRVGEGASIDRKRVLGDRIGRQQIQNAAVPFAPCARLLLTRCLVMGRRCFDAGRILRQRRGRQSGQQREAERAIPKSLFHDGYCRGCCAHVPATIV